MLATAQLLDRNSRDYRLLSRFNIILYPPSPCFSQCAIRVIVVVLAPVTSLIRRYGIPSSISLYSKHCHTYGDPESEYNLQETVIEYSKHWYLYPHQYLKNLPSDQYIRVRYQDLVADPEGTIEEIYNRFGFDLSPEYARILRAEAEKAKTFKSKHRYSLRKMGLSKRRIEKEFQFVDKLLEF